MGGMYLIWLRNIADVLSYRMYHINTAISILLLLVLLLRKPVAKSILLLNTLWLLPLASFFCYNFTLIDRLVPRFTDILFHAFSLFPDLLLKHPDVMVVLARIEYYSKYVFLIGVLVTAFLIRLGTRRLRRVMKQGTVCGIKPDVMARAKQDAGINRQIELRQVRFETSPLVYGIFRPRIYLPYNWEVKYTERELHMILVHELTHVRQGDLLLRVFCQALRCLLWYNPLIHIAMYYFISDREILCDAKVLANRSISKSEYGTMLLRESVGDKALAVASLRFSSEKGLKHRVKTIAGHGRYRQLAAASIAGSVLLLMLCVALAANSEPTFMNDPLLVIACIEDDLEADYEEGVMYNHFNLEVRNTADTDYFKYEGTTLYVSNELLHMVDDARNPETQHTFRADYYGWTKVVGSSSESSASPVYEIRTFDLEDVPSFVAASPDDIYSIPTPPLVQAMQWLWMHL